MQPFPAIEPDLEEEEEEEEQAISSAAHSTSAGRNKGTEEKKQKLYRAQAYKAERDIHILLKWPLSSHKPIES